MFLANQLICRLSFAIVLWGLAAGCRPKISFPDFNSQAWMSDSFACQSVRSKMIPELKKIKSKLEGLATTQVMGVLGKPDGEALLASNERIYYYYLQPGSQCQNSRELSTANKLMVRFDALERVKEVLFEQPIP
ncbi:hypothetical protein AHMF7605_05590 [Adhaeribacter arboris]|uniref:Lipoprotein SmpA/OmlA domain-containing protein n=1 Tax=Adhaeribacter arboris TaxID=2072846 RepID=A0A2T2YC18_9BACT|nr:hypothetical protein [Adhaeribacter arboris]PSR53036.1 hypothetical protein AHMF7605_05590 [Adhaeribacter arboris]